MLDAHPIHGSFDPPDPSSQTTKYDFGVTLPVFAAACTTMVLFNSHGMTSY